MRVLLVSNGFSGASLCYRFHREGHEVRAVVAPAYRAVLDTVIPKAPDLDAGLAWVGKEGLVLFDDVGLGRLQDELRARGYAVVGGSELGERLETDREFGQRVFADCGMKTLPSAHFEKVDEALAFVCANPAEWVLKQNNHDRTFCYVGEMPDGSDILDLLA